MKTKFTLILLLILSVASIWYFKFYERSSKISITSLLPQSSVGVILSTNPSETITELSKQTWWATVQNIPFLNNSVKEIKSIQSLIDNQQLQSKLDQLEHTLSLHITANDQIETLHFVKSNDFSWSKKSVEDIIGLLWPDLEVNFSERNYENMVINEVKLGNGNFSYLIISDFLIFSSNAILIEDVIRTATRKTTSLFDHHQARLRRPGNLNLVLNVEKLDDLERVFFSNVGESQETMRGLLQLELTARSNQIVINGLIEEVDRDESKFQEDINLNERDYLPNGLSQLEVVALKNNITANPTHLGFDLGQFLAAHQGSLVTLELDAGGQLKERAILAAINHPDLIRRNLDDLALRLVKDQTDTLYQERFMDASITFLNKESVNRDLYGADVADFEECYYAINNNMLILGESVDVVKLILREYDNENTWGKIVPRRQFLDNLIQDAALTKLINFQFSVDELKQQLKPKWQEFFNDQQPLLDLIDLVSIQLSKSGRGFYASNQITLNPLVQTSAREVSTGATSKELTLVSNTFADAEIITRPYVVRNHNDGSQEILFQDSNGEIYLISKEGTVLWKKANLQKINGSVSQVDFFNNKRLQYLFYTDSAIHLIDRNGDYVDGFPKSLSTELPILNSSIVDYDNSKRYRYLGIDRRGSTYLFDQQGELLEGWAPKVGAPSLLVQPEHVRVRGKDCFFFVRTDGTIELTNRRGEAYPNFPFSVGKRLSGDVRLKKGPDFDRTTILVSTLDGLQLEVDFNGAVKSRVQLFKPAVSSRFMLVTDILETDHVVIRKDEDSTLFFDSSGEELFSNDLVLDDDDQISFYNFKNESELYLVNRDGQLHVLDKLGQSKFSTSIKTNYEVGVVYYQSRGEYELFINFENQFAIYKFEK